MSEREKELDVCMKSAQVHIWFTYVNIKLTRSGTINRKTFILLPRKFHSRIPISIRRMILRPPKRHFPTLCEFPFEFSDLTNIVRHCVWMCNGEGNFMVAPKSLFIQASCNHNPSEKLDKECDCDASDRCKLAKNTCNSFSRCRVHRRTNKTKLHKMADGRKSLEIVPRSLIETDKQHDESDAESIGEHRPMQCASVVNFLRFAFHCLCDRFRKEV